jgi:hypothetical protein
MTFTNTRDLASYLNAIDEDYHDADPYVVALAAEVASLSPPLAPSPPAHLRPALLSDAVEEDEFEVSVVAYLRAAHG